MSHPYLDPELQVAWSKLTADAVEADIELALQHAEANIQALVAQDRGRLTYDSVMMGLQNATQVLDTAWTRVDHLMSVCDSPERRQSHRAMLPKVTAFYTSLSLREDLWDLIKTYQSTTDASKLTGIEKRYLEETVASFRQNGADLPAEKKRRLEEIENELAELTQKFAENVLDSTNAWEFVTDDLELLCGLPESALAMARADAEANQKGTPEKPVYRFTLKAPSIGPVLEHLENEAIRRQFWAASADVARTGAFDNTEILWKILNLRQEKAELFGKANFADWVLERRMAKNGATALAFVENLHRQTEAFFNEEIARLQAYKSEVSNQPSDLLEPWEVAYWSEKRRRQLFDFEEEELRPYFPIDQVIDGMFRLCEKIFEIELKERETFYVAPGEPYPEDLNGKVEVWHPEVKYYEIYNEHGTLLGGFYADWHPRDSKRGGAWMNCLQSGSPPYRGQERRPHLGLIAGNMTPSTPDRPALLVHREVETVFHEFGHLLHQILGSVPIHSLNGTNVAWDFVELPSQIMENFCWDRESLDFFARHYQTGEPIPAKLYKKMLTARTYQGASLMMRQLTLGKLDLELHIHHAKKQAHEVDLDDLARQILKGYLQPLKTASPTIARRFTHLFGHSTGYAAGYYSYKWAEVLDADAFSRFQREGVLNSKVGREFRDKILAKGNSEDPNLLFRDFMGRDPEPKALLERAGLAR